MSATNGAMYMYRGSLSGRLQGTYPTPGHIKPAKGLNRTKLVKVKVDGGCLWSACRAVTIGVFLIIVGTLMAVIGYYSEDLSMFEKREGNQTIIVKDENRGFHLSNLSYVGPVIMGVGSFIIVAACVMTFEARDKGAKIVPQPLKTNKDKNVYDLIIENMTRKRDGLEENGKQPNGIPGLTVQSQSRLLKYMLNDKSGPVAGALLRFTKDIFTIDMDKNKNTADKPKRSSSMSSLDKLKKENLIYRQTPLKIASGLPRRSSKAYPLVRQAKSADDTLEPSPRRLRHIIQYTQRDSSESHLSVPIMSNTIVEVHQAESADDFIVTDSRPSTRTSSLHTDSMEQPVKVQVYEQPYKAKRNPPLMRQASVESLLDDGNPEDYS